MPGLQERLNELGLVLPPARAPLANYVPVRRVNSLLFTAGQVSGTTEREIKGKLGGGLSIEEGQQAARLALLNGLAAIVAALGSLEAVRQVVRMSVFVNSAAGFEQQPAVANGASDLLVQIFGEAGRHARTAVGVSELPAGYAVELELTVEVAEGS